ncbi:MAG: ribokinase [Clostridia bacterium]|nr:ribokinase [Clostridia bacterium]MBO4884091.1 ribokinase [Clostridia bacterium]
MKTLVFGSVNIDHVYRLSHLVREGETISSDEYRKNEGGKGTNQAVALAKAGLEVWFAGAIGKDGQFMKDYLTSFGVNTDDLRTLDAPTGHAIIQVDEEGRNSIILYGGANRMITPEMIGETLSHFAAGDYVLLQNEISGGEEIIRQAAGRGMHVALNPSPVSEELLSWPLELVEWLILNEIEGADITGLTDTEAMLDELLRRYPNCRVVLTLGEMGSVYADGQRRVRQGIMPVDAVDTTAAGDTFTGYFLQTVLAGGSVENALRTAAQAASIAVSRPGAGRSIPLKDEVRSALRAEARK